MSIANTFRNAAESFNGQPFGKEELRERFYHLLGHEDKHHFDTYFSDFLRGTANKDFRLVKVGQQFTVEKNEESDRAIRTIATSYAPFIRDPSVFSTNDDALKFLIYIIKEWDRYFNDIGAVGIAPAGVLRYLKPTDSVLLSRSGLTDTQYIFKELALHAQNSPMSNSIKFLSKDSTGAYPRQNFVKDITGNYGLNPAFSLLHSASGLSRAFSSEGIAKNAQWDKYITILQDIENYLYPHGIAPKTHADVVNDFSPSPTVVTMVEKARSVCDKFADHFPHGFKVALTLDFLKEFDPLFDYPKPDTHVKRIIYYLYQTSPVLVKNPENIMDDFNTIALVEELFNKANASYIAHGGTGRLTVYLIDKIIYLLCCKSPLYLPGEPSVSQSLTRRHKEGFIDTIIRKDYLAETITTANIALVDRHL